MQLRPLGSLFTKGDIIVGSGSTVFAPRYLILDEIAKGYRVLSIGLASSKNFKLSFLRTIGATVSSFLLLPEFFDFCNELLLARFPEF